MNFDDREPFFVSSKEKGAKRISFTVIMVIYGHDADLMVIRTRDHVMHLFVPVLFT